MRQTSKAAPEVFSATVTAGPHRLDQFLASQEGVKSRSEAVRLIADERVKVNGKVVTKPAMSIRFGDKIEFFLRDTAAVPEDVVSSTKLAVLFEDDFCMVINKPFGLSVHPGNGMKTPEETVLHAVKALFAERKIPYSEKEILVHRLDKDTTGCLLIAKTPEAHAFLQKQFADRTVRKTYLTVVAGKPNLPTATIDAPIGRHGTERTKMSIHQAVRSRTAKTTYRTITSARGASVLECDLHTGRTHQIRVHLASIGHPVLGDMTYGTNASHVGEEALGVESLCLHAKKLSFTSPSKKKIDVEAPVPERLQEVLKQLGVNL